jgi:FkbM family methyltransferase
MTRKNGETGAFSGAERLSLLRHRLAKGWQLLPALAARPRRIAWLLEGVGPGRLVALDIEWLREASISTVLDIGANTGQFATAIRHILPRATIHSFEPLPECHELMTRRMADDPLFHAYNVAVGDEDRTVEFMRNDFSQSSSVLPMADLHKQAFAWSSRASRVNVQMNRLDTLLGPALPLAARVLVKIDVQGFEDRVLAGGERVISSAHIVMVETSLQPLYEGQASFDQVYSMLKSYGFSYGGNMDQLSDPRDGRILQADALFFRDDP